MLVAMSAQQMPPLRICGACGASIPRRKSACDVCGGSSLSARDVRTNEAIGTFARLVASFQCRSCGQRSPLDGFDVDGTVTCTGCGLTQAFDVGVWSKAFAFVHGLVDLGRSPATDADTQAGLANPFFESGETRARYVFATTGLVTIDGVQRTASIEVDAAVGHPLCPRCSAPVDLQPSGAALEAICPGCGDRATYALPTSSVHIAPMPVALIASDARTDATDVRVEGNVGAIAIRCPSCSASLAAHGHDAVITCTYCRTLCRIPRATLKALVPNDKTPTPFFVAFRGPSLMRSRLREEVRAAYAARENERQLEPFPVIPPSPQIITLRTAMTALVLALVGLLYVPRVLALIETAMR